MKKSLNMKKGFTLIELLVVVAIIGTLTAIVLIGVNNGINAGRDAAIKSSMNQLAVQMELLLQESGGSSYPDPLSADTTNTTRETRQYPTNNAVGRNIGDLVPKLTSLIEKIESQGSQKIVYHYNNSGMPSYRIIALLPGQKLNVANQKAYCIDSNGYSGNITLTAANQSTNNITTAGSLSYMNIINTANGMKNSSVFASRRGTTVSFQQTTNNENNSRTATAPDGQSYAGEAEGTSGNGNRCN